MIIYSSQKFKTEYPEFPSNQFYQEKTPKKQIVLHHTVSDGSNANGDINYWKSTTSRVATSLIITENGTRYECFSPEYWGHALGIKQAVFKKHGFSDYVTKNTELNKASINIELDSLGPVDQYGNSIAYGSRLKAENIQEYEVPYRGYKYYEKYTEEAIESLYYVLKDLTEIYEIPSNYINNMWDVSKDALIGTPGIWSHTSFRDDKSDCHPQPELIQMLKSL